MCTVDTQDWCLRPCRRLPGILRTGCRDLRKIRRRATLSGPFCRHPAARGETSSALTLALGTKAAETQVVMAIGADSTAILVQCALRAACMAQMS